MHRKETTSETKNYNRHIDTLKEYFLNPSNNKQIQYEIIRAVIVDNKPIKEVAKSFNYKINSIYSLLRDFKAKKINLFPKIKKGPNKRRVSDNVCDKIITYRNKQMSTIEISEQLKNEKVEISARTIERIIKDHGFTKLKRRTKKALKTTRNNKSIPERSKHLDFSELKPFSVDTPTIGIFFFLPYILESGIIDIINDSKLPKSKDIGALQACLSMLALKLIGQKRLSHMYSYDSEPGLGVFAGLNLLPKSTYMSTYSCRFSQTKIMDFQNKIISFLKNQYPGLYKSNFINLDFHSIPHYGDESQMEKVWCGAKGKALKGANTIFAQDSQSNLILYTRADILRNEESNEIKKFASYWKKINSSIKETLVFDCKFTKYKVLDELQNDNVNFITLRKRNSSLIKKALLLPNAKWKKAYISIPKRKYKQVSVYEEKVKLPNCKNSFRQIIVKDHGRVKPTFIITNNKKLALKTILEVYAKRWRIENKFAEMISFFNLNALSSPIMIRIHFDVIWTVIADSLYHIFAQDLRRFENILASTIFKKFIDMPGRVVFDGDKFLIKIRKRAHTPILKEVKKLHKPISLPWLDNKTIEIVWTA